MTPINPTTAIDPDSATTPTPNNPTVDLLAEPTIEEITEEWNRYYDNLKSGRLSFTGIPEKRYIAYFDGRIVDHDPDFIILQHRAAAKIGVHWARLVIRYYGDWP